MDKVWVLLITTGTVIRGVPEVYRGRGRAVVEARRWAEFLASLVDPTEIERPFSGRWEVGEWSVRLVSARLPDAAGTVWVGTYWTADGYPDPEAELFIGEAPIRRWLEEPPSGMGSGTLGRFDDGTMAVTYIRGGEEEYAVARRAKVVEER